MHLEQLGGLNFKTGMKKDGRKPAVERPEQIWADIGAEADVETGAEGAADTGLLGAAVHFPLRKAYGAASMTAQSVDQGD
eukprot:67056-Pyramimonas_sp.AAC.1